MATNEIKGETKRQPTPSRRSQEYIHRIEDASARVHTPILRQDEIVHHDESIEDEELRRQEREQRKSKTD